MAMQQRQSTYLWQTVGVLALFAGLTLPTPALPAPVSTAGSTPAVAPGTITPPLLRRIATDPQANSTATVAAAIRFGKLDRNKDALISQAEAEYDAGLSARFNELDRDHSGALDISEYATYTQQLARNQPQ